MFTLMADETADVANIEQLVISIRWVDEQLNAHEEFIGLHPIPDTTANTIVSLLKVSIKVLKLFDKIDNDLTQKTRTGFNIQMIMEDQKHSLELSDKGFATH